MTDAPMPATPSATDPSAPRLARGWLHDAVRDFRCTDEAHATTYATRDLGALAVARDGRSIALDATASAGAAATEWLLGVGLVQAFARRNLFALHASAGVRDGGLVAYCAASGTGKSTLGRALRRATGWSRVADDIVPVTIDDDGARAWPRFPQLKVAPRDWYPEAAPAAVSLRAIVVLTPRGVAGAPSRLAPAAARRALVANTAGARLFDAVLLARHLDAMTRLARAVPVFALTVAERPDDPDGAADEALVRCAALVDAHD